MLTERTYDRDVFKFVPNLTTICIFINIHTYIIGHYNPSVRIIDLVSHITYVVCVNFKC